MELDLTSDQDLFRSTASKFIQATCPLTMVRQLVATDPGLPADYGRASAELGWFAMLIPEAHGGGSVSGRGVLDAALIAEERGRWLQPGPFLSMNVVAAALVAEGTAEQQERILPAIAAGDGVATWVLADRAGMWAPGAAVSASAVAGGFRLSGAASLVEHGALADWLLVTACAAEGVSQFVVPARMRGVTIAPLVSHDVTQRFATVGFDDVMVPATALVGEVGDGARQVEKQIALACVLSVSETVGAMAALFELTCAYALERTAFGRPIGSFQAVKHQLADMGLALESSKAVAAAAARAVQANEDYADEVSSIAKAWVGDAGIDLAQGCFQVFAGIAYTWEHDFHLFLRRITMNSLMFGQPDWHRERICRIHGV